MLGLCRFLDGLAPSSSIVYTYFMRRARLLTIACTSTGESVCFHCQLLLPSCFVEEDVRSTTVPGGFLYLTSRTVLYRYVSGFSNKLRAREKKRRSARFLTAIDTGTTILPVCLPCNDGDFMRRSSLFTSTESQQNGRYCVYSYS